MTGAECILTDAQANLIMWLGMPPSVVAGLYVFSAIERRLDTTGHWGRDMPRRFADAAVLLAGIAVWAVCATVLLGTLKDLACSLL